MTTIKFQKWRAVYVLVEKTTDFSNFPNNWNSGKDRAKFALQDDMHGFSEHSGTLK